METLVPVLVWDTGSTEFLGLAASDWVAVGSGLGGALLGSLVAGIIAAWLQVKAADHAHRLQMAAIDHSSKQHEIARIAAARDNAVRLMMRASQILVHIRATVDSLHRQLENANRYGLTGHPMWARVPGIVGSTRLQLFEVDELAPFLEAHEFALVSRCVELGLQHEVLVASIDQYNRVRAKMKDLIPPDALEDGTLFDSDKEKVLARLVPYTAELNALMAQIKHRSETQLSRARELNVLIGERGEKLFGPGFPHVNPAEMDA
ncbi:MAG: hypothetical protein P0Y65_17015 [Candidatus Devosia phytovorans]|uniref:Uncharacterized protein n=1 Tax=Candidatus Devosia phytovorans TaxID=3121372 RepID=A0AAJ5VUU1_9HYPH|nr:hypothetical protein [Devosia sp.]WEK03873.1 MAG: hypothetical protein P0Y65_17015 [Devosia sp.]